LGAPVFCICRFRGCLAVPAPVLLISSFLRTEGTCGARLFQTGFEVVGRCLHPLRVEFF
jgi:hypothetical protein